MPEQDVQKRSFVREQMARLPTNVLRGRVPAIIWMVPALFVASHSNRVSTETSATASQAGSTVSWIGHDRSVLRDSVWFQSHGYSDCSSFANIFWPENIADCAFSDRGTGPTSGDRKVLPLTSQENKSYPKHLTPTDGFVDNNPQEPGKIEFTDSFSSLHVGLQNGKNGRRVNYVVLSIHPTFEARVINRKDPASVRRRAAVLVEPFLEGATGIDVTTDQADTLYDAALNHCGTGAINKDQSGYGTRIEFNTKFAAAVVKWKPRPVRGLIARDCKIFAGSNTLR